MRKTRFINLLFLVLSIAFFFVPDFRQAMQGPLLGLSIAHSYDWLEETGRIPPRTLDGLIRTARERGDAKTLAFAAMHPPGGSDEMLRLAAEAVAIDPKLTWIYPKVFLNLKESERNSLAAKKMLAGLEAWDSDNSIPYLYEGAQMLFGRDNSSFPNTKPDDLVNETEWRNVMAKAFAAPRYDSYARNEFDLERAWLMQHHMAKPATMLLMVTSFPIPHLLNIRAYSEFLDKKLGEDAEAAGHLPEAMNYYWTAAHMGEQIKLNGPSLIEKLIGIAIEKAAYQHLIPVLRRTGRENEAATLQSSLDQSQRTLDELAGKDPMAHSMNYKWAALMVLIFDGMVAAFGVLTLASVAYVNAKRWVRVEKKGRIYQFVTVAENYLPIIFFLSCLGLYLCFYPYARNFHHYMTAGGAFHDLEPFIYNVFPAPELVPGNNGLPIENPFLPYLWYALVGLALAVLAQLPGRKRT
jgi:hypothetical protein